MKYRLTILNVAAFLLIAFCIIYIIANYAVLNSELGLGMLAMIVWIILGVIALIIDLLLQRFVKNKVTQLILDVVVIIIFIAITIGSN